MMVIGLSGGFDTTWRLDYDLPYDFFHDAGAVLLEDGKMVAAVEQERLNRIKHTNRSPTPAIRACLEAHGATIKDVDCFAYCATEANADQILYAYHTRKGVGNKRMGIRAQLQQSLEEEFGCNIPAKKFHFADHHMCHALGAYIHSGFTDGLVITLDGAGEGNACLILRVRGKDFEQLRWVPDTNSLGYFYREVIRFLGYDMFEEYKVMGLAPYGDPSHYREIFKSFYELLPEGEFIVHLQRIPQLHAIMAPRKANEPITTLHKNIAASLQEALEILVFHMLRYFQKSTGELRLCLSGGVAHNSSLNGKILKSGLFDDVFVHPASHDAGGALGAALDAHRLHCPDVPSDSLDHLFLGKDIGDSVRVIAGAKRWSPMVTIEQSENPSATAAQMLAQGQVIGWVQGRSEFGPRSLGNRSILADPRPEKNMTRINQMIKKREGYRPFAPSVLAKHLKEYFEVPPWTTELPYMTYVVPVHPEKRALLGAVTHIDGSARVQTVTRSQNERYYKLIEAFAERTGVPILLNTSFNNNVEPIVDSIDEAIACYLTTELDALVIGDFIIKRRNTDLTALEEMALVLPDTVVCQHVDMSTRKGKRVKFQELVIRGNNGRSRKVSEETSRVLLEASRHRALSELMNANELKASVRDAVLNEIQELWGERLILILPIEVNK
jgi:carbamoyltransferase